MTWTVAERVARGVKVLDAYFGSREAWFSKVKWNLLRMESTLLCVLGQLYGEYDTGLSELEAYWLETDSEDYEDIPMSHGFELAWDDNFAESEITLRNEWRKLLTV